MNFSHFLRNFLILALIVSSAFIAKSSDAASKAASKPDVAIALNTWKAAVESGDLKEIMKLYATDAMMISTFAQAPLTKRSQIEDYFKLVLANEGVRVDILESHPRNYGDIAINDGRYELSYVQEGEEISIPARFTFVYKRVGSQWIIIDQHASQMPDTREKK